MKQRVKQPQFCVLQGNPVDGLTITGPFETQDAALAWVEDNDADTEWWVAQMEVPT